MYLYTYAFGSLADKNLAVPIGTNVHLHLIYYYLLRQFWNLAIFSATVIIEFPLGYKTARHKGADEWWKYLWTVQYQLDNLSEQFQHNTNYHWCKVLTINTRGMMPNTAGRIWNMWFGFIVPPECAPHSSCKSRTE